MARPNYREKKVIGWGGKKLWQLNIFKEITSMAVVK